MVGAVSLNPYVSGYQYTGSHVRTRAMAQNTQIQAGQGTGASAGVSAVSTGKRGGVSSLIGARSIAAAGQAAGVAGVSVGRGADPESPIEPVDSASSVKPGNSGSTNYSIPFLRKGMDPAELAVRMRMQDSGQGAGKEAVQIDLPGSSQGAESEAVQLKFPGTSPGEAEQLGLPGTETGKAAEAGLPGASSETDSSAVDSATDTPEIAGLKSGDAQKMTEDAECKTCKERKYQDGSDDPGVSFKMPTHIGPDQSASSVLGHEMEHVVRERAKAQSEGRRVISQSVTMQSGICPECGRVYTAGGMTRTVTAADTKQEEQPKDPRWILAASA